MLSPSLLVPWEMVVCCLAHNGANAMALLKLARSKGVYPENVTQDLSVALLINASFIKCYVSGTVPVSKNSKMKNVALASMASKSSQGRKFCAWSIQSTVQTGALGKLHRDWNPQAAF